MFELPTTVEINGNHYKIRANGDYRMVLDCFSALNDSELDESYRTLTCLIIFYDGVKSESDLFKLFGDNVKEAVLKMYEFFNCGQPQSPGAATNYVLINWSTDAQLIAGAVNSVARQEVRALPYLHWWTFMGYYLNIGDGAFSTIVNIRHKIKANKKLEKHEKEFKRNNPQYFIWDDKTVKDKEADELIRNLWNSGG